MYALTIHGGAGTIQPGAISQEEENAYHSGLQEALEAGYRILLAKGSALDAVEAAVRNLEDNPLFNAGKGAVFTNEGTHELEASIMCGKTLNAGAASALIHIKNPVSLARAVMEKSEYVYLSGEGAEQFAMEQKMELALDDYFFTHERYQEWREKQNKEWAKANAKADESPVTGKSKGTVGAVALDLNGNLAAATSTGGLTGKKFGRIGDTPLIGCGTYADNSCCGVSCTGDGEFFIRSVAAHTVHSLISYKSMSVQDACDYLINTTLKAIQGEGGLIVIDRYGNIGQSYNSPSMHRGSIMADGTWFTAVFENKRYTTDKKNSSFNLYSNENN